MVYFNSMFSFSIVEVECDKDEFTCDSGRCISIKHRCDGSYDCGREDLSDEKNCTKSKSTTILLL